MKYLDYQEHRQQGTSDFPIAYYLVDETRPRYYMTCHWHPEYEIIRILDGSLHLTANNTNYDLTAGDMVLLQDGMLHSGTPNHCVYECLVFDLLTLLKDSRIMKKQIENIQNHVTLFHPLLPREDEELTNVIHTLFHTMTEKRIGYEFAVVGSLYQFLGLLFEKKLYELTQKNEQHSHDRMKHLKQVISYIENNYTEDIKLDELASIAGMNPKYFCRFFKQSTQRTPISYLNYYRIERAAQQLSTAETSITEVALSCGFNDISYFIKSFKKAKGITPKQFVKHSHSIV